VDLFIEVSDVPVDPILNGDTWEGTDDRRPTDRHRSRIKLGRTLAFWRMIWIDVRLAASLVIVPDGQKSARSADMKRFAPPWDGSPSGNSDSRRGSPHRASQRWSNSLLRP